METSLKAEKNSVVFYTGLKEFVPKNADKSKIEDIIKEEIRHIAYLNRRLLELKKA